MPQTQILATDQVAQAAALLRGGGLVAFPTETVYGLGADATNDHAVAGIFAAKGRPSFNPLIVHVADLAAAQAVAKFTPQAIDLARAFWPGALTVVLPLKPGAGIAPLVTAGLDTVAVRVPAHPLAQALLRDADRPIAAPSANPSGCISPTTAAHVLSGLAGKIAAILDGGACPVGLESTIIGFLPRPTLLRPGGISSEAIQQHIAGPLATHASGINAPGQMTSHYAPAQSLRLNVTHAEPGDVLLGFGDVPGDVSLSTEGDLTEAAANLFGHLHQLDATGRPIAVAPIPEHGLGRAINDRLRRAAAPRTA